MCGAAGSYGVGIQRIEEQYCHSSSSTARAGGSGTSLYNFPEVGTAGGSKTAPIASTVAVKFAPGDVIGLLTETVITYSTSTIPKGSNVSYTKSTAASITLSWTASSENYNNMYYANGLLLSSSDKKYIAANSSSTATAILQARSGSAIFKFSSSGLLQSLNIWRRLKQNSK